MTLKRDKFIIEYIRCWNGTESATLAGFAHPRQQASRLLADVNIKAKIQAHLDERAVSANEVLARLGDQARGSIEDFIDILPAGHQVIVNLEKAQKANKLHLIKKLEVTPKGGIKIELYDAHAALVDLGRHHKQFTDRVEIKVGIKAYENISPDDWDTDSPPTED